jgi:hypothetical protein
MLKAFSYPRSAFLSVYHYLAFHCFIALGVVYIMTNILSCMNTLRLQIDRLSKPMHMLQVFFLIHHLLLLMNMSSHT